MVIMDYIDHYTSALGNITLASDGECLIGLWFDDQKFFGSTLSNSFSEKSLSIFEEAKCWLDVYFKGEAPNFTPPLNLRGTAFRKLVWEILLGVAYGETLTYGEIAKDIVSENDLTAMSSQAVGGAVGRNPISLIIPCHRVVGADGALTGYAAGLERKQQLLKLEKVMP